MTIKIRKKCIYCGRIFSLNSSQVRKKNFCCERHKTRYRLGLPKEYEDKNRADRRKENKYWELWVEKKRLEASLKGEI